jgi:hypothetical protein
MRSRSSRYVPWVALFVASSAAALVTGCGEDGSAPPAVVDAGGTPKDTGAMNDVVLVDLVTPEDRARIDAGMSEDRVTVSDRGVVDDRATDTGAAGDRGATDTGVSVGPYPAGPYGIQEGDVLRDLEWEGYVNLAGGVVSTMRPYGRTNLQAMRETGRRYAIVHVSEFY